MNQGHKPIDISGRVIKEETAKGSKSERPAVLLETRQGTYVLRRQGGHPFLDPELEKLVGHTIQCKGILTANTLILSSWSVKEL